MAYKNVNIILVKILVLEFPQFIPYSIFKNCIIFFLIFSLTHSTHLHESLKSGILFLTRLDHFQGERLVTAKGGSSLFQLLLPWSTELCQEREEHKREWLTELILGQAK